MIMLAEEEWEGKNRGRVQGTANLGGGVTCGTGEELPQSSWLTGLRMNERSLVGKLIFMQSLVSAESLFPSCFGRGGTDSQKNAVVQH